MTADAAVVATSLTRALVLRDVCCDVDVCKYLTEPFSRRTENLLHLPDAIFDVFIYIAQCSY